MRVIRVPVAGMARSYGQQDPTVTTQRATPATDGVGAGHAREK
jgi:hypothetical protein